MGPSLAQLVFVPPDPCSHSFNPLPTAAAKQYSCPALQLQCSYETVHCSCKPVQHPTPLATHLPGQNKRQQPLHSVCPKEKLKTRSRISMGQAGFVPRTSQLAQPNLDPTGHHSVGKVVQPQPTGNIHGEVPHNKWQRPEKSFLCGCILVVGVDGRGDDCGGYVLRNDKQYRQDKVACGCFPPNWRVAVHKGH
jgi:hypothetical protein